MPRYKLSLFILIIVFQSRKLKVGALLSRRLLSLHVKMYALYLVWDHQVINHRCLVNAY